jgi:hypothetical protein
MPGKCARKWNRGDIDSIQIKKLLVSVSSISAVSLYGQIAILDIVFFFARFYFSQFIAAKR